jgi:periplasmic divalent cation tolerance protein
MTPVIALTTVGAADDARRIANELVERRLAACVNIIDSVRSIYRWEGRISDDSEQLLIIKTVEERLEALRAHLMSIHPYEVPEFVVLTIDQIAQPYAQWLVGSVSPE